MNDYHAFNSTTGGSSGSGPGCSGSVLTWVIVIVAIISFIGECFG